MSLQFVKNLYFHWSVEKRRGKLGRFVSFNESHVYCDTIDLTLEFKLYLKANVVLSKVVLKLGNSNFLGGP